MINIKRIKLFLIFLMIAIIINIAQPVYASSTTVEDIFKTGANFIENGKKQKSAFNGEKMKNSVDTLYNLFLWGGIAIAIIVGASLGIKYMFESVEGKAKILQSLIPFTVGCAIIFGGFTIWKISMELFSSVESTVSEEAKTKNTQCVNGLHTFDSLNDKICNYCGFECMHQKSDWIQGFVWCEDMTVLARQCGRCKGFFAICGNAPVAKNGSIYAENTKPVRTAEEYLSDYKNAHDWRDGICMTCRIECDHSFLYTDVANGRHYCIYGCGYSDLHTRGSDGKCTVCGYELEAVASCTEHKWSSYGMGQTGHKCEICGDSKPHGNFKSDGYNHICGDCGHQIPRVHLTKDTIVDEGVERSYCKECDYSCEHELICDVDAGVMKCQKEGCFFSHKPCGPGPGWDPKYCTLVDAEDEGKKCKVCGMRYPGIK